MNIQRPSCALAVALIATQVLGPAVLWAADQRGIRVEENRRILIAAISGEQLMLHNGGDSKALHFREAVNAGDQIVTGDRTVAEVLIGNRAVVTLGQGTTAQVIAVSENQTTIQVKKGSVRVAASAMALGGQGKITVQTPTGQVQTRGGIIRVMVDAPMGSAEQLPIGAAKPYRASYSPNTLVAAVNTRGDIIQVEEGTAEIPGAGPGGGTLTVRSGQAVTLQSGQAGSMSGLVNRDGMRAGILATAGHSKTPKEGLDNLVALQVEQATALGKALTGAAETGGEKSGKKDDTKNAINGATGGVALASGLIVQSTTPTSGTLTFRNSNFTVSGSLATVDAAQTESVRDPTTDKVTQSANQTNIDAPRTKLIANEANGFVAPTGSELQAGSANTALSPTGDNTEIYRILGPGEKTKFALLARILNSSDNGNTSPDVTFSDGVNVVNSTVTVNSLASLISVNVSNSSNLQTPIINFNKSAFSSSSSKLGGAIDAIFTSTGTDIPNAKEILHTINAGSPNDPLVRLVDTTNTPASIQNAVYLDRAILLASAPLVSLFGTVVGDQANNKTKIDVAQDFLKLLNTACVAKSGCANPNTALPADAIVALNASNLVITGALANLSSNSSLIVTNLATLANGSSLTAATLASLSGSSFLRVTGSLVNFEGAGNTLAITGVCGASCFNITGTQIPVLLTGGATLGNNTFSVAAGYHAFTGSNAPALSTFANMPLLTVDGAGNTVNLGL